MELDNNFHLLKVINAYQKRFYLSRIIIQSLQNKDNVQGILFKTISGFNDKEKSFFLKELKICMNINFKSKMYFFHMIKFYYQHASRRGYFLYAHAFKSKRLHQCNQLRAKNTCTNC